MTKREVKISNVKDQSMSWPGAEKKLITMKKKVVNKRERSSGFIFTCSTETMQEFFQCQVFGLPAEKREVVKKIKEGNRLFVFDSNTKLLHGVYKATCKGQMNLEPSAFGGRLPAQVRFYIHRRCVPIPESTFKSIIADNYQGGAEFEPELSAKQVRRLVPLLRWCPEPTPPSVAPYPYLEKPSSPSDPCLSQLQSSHHVNVAPKIEPPLPPLVKPPVPIDPSQFQYSHRVDIVPKVDPPPSYLRGASPPLVPYASQFTYKPYVNVVPNVEPPLAPVNPCVSQFQYSHRVDIVPKVEPPLPHLVRPLQYGHPVDVVPRIDPPQCYGNAGAMGLVSQTIHSQDVPGHPSEQHYVLENWNQFYPGDSTQLVQDRYLRNSSFSLPVEYEDEDKRSDSDDGSFEDLTPEHDNRFEDLTPEHDNGDFRDREIISSAAAGKNLHIAEKVDNKLKMKDVSPKRDTLKSSNSNNDIHAAQYMTRFGGVHERDSELLEATVAKCLNPYQTSEVLNNTYPPTATSYHSYPSTTYPYAQTYIHPHQGVVSAKVEPPKINAPISSLFSFQGPSK